MPYFEQVWRFQPASIPIGGVDFVIDKAVRNSAVRPSEDVQLCEMRPLSLPQLAKALRKASEDLMLRNASLQNLVISSRVKQLNLWHASRTSCYLGMIGRLMKHF